MFFDILRGTWAEQEDFFYSCLDCEKCVRIDPDCSVLSARKALEYLTWILLDKNGINIPNSIDERRALKLENLSDCIERCLQEGFISHFQSELMRKIRKRCNAALFTAHSTDVGEAVTIFENLYKLVVSIVKQIPPDKVRLTEEGQSLEDWLPIGDYEVLEIINQDDKSEKKIPTYKCVLSENRKVYAIIRRYKKDDEAYSRQIDTICLLYELRKRFGDLLLHEPANPENIYVSQDCEYRYIKYTTAHDTILLSQAAEFKKMKLNPKNILQIMENIVDILDSLTDIGDGVSIHHRGLNPESIFVTPNRKGYNVRIGDFECTTVKDESVYMPPEVRDGAILDISDPNWEQIDVYSCAVILLYLSYRVTPHTDRFEAWLSKLTPYFSAEVINMTKDILTSPYGSRPTLNKYLKVIRKELALK